MKLKSIHKQIILFVFLINGNQKYYSVEIEKSLSNKEQFAEKNQQNQQNQQKVQGKQPFGLNASTTYSDVSTTDSDSDSETLKTTSPISITELEKKDDEKKINAKAVGGLAGVAVIGVGTMWWGLRSKQSIDHKDKDGNVKTFKAISQEPLIIKTKDGKDLTVETKEQLAVVCNDFVKQFKKDGSLSLGVLNNDARKKELITALNQSESHESHKSYNSQFVKTFARMDLGNELNFKIEAFGNKPSDQNDPYFDYGFIISVYSNKCGNFEILNSKNFDQDMMEKGFSDFCQKIQETQLKDKESQEKPSESSEKTQTWHDAIASFDEEKRKAFAYMLSSISHYLSIQVRKINTEHIEKQKMARDVIVAEKVEALKKSQEEEIKKGSMGFSNREAILKQYKIYKSTEHNINPYEKLLESMLVQKGKETNTDFTDCIKDEREGDVFEFFANFISLQNNQQSLSMKPVQLLSLPEGISQQEVDEYMKKKDQQSFDSMKLQIVDINDRIQLQDQQIKDFFDFYQIGEDRIKTLYQQIAFRKIKAIISSKETDNKEEEIERLLELLTNRCKKIVEYISDGCVEETRNNLCFVVRNRSENEFLSDCLVDYLTSLSFFIKQRYDYKTLKFIDLTDQQIINLKEEMTPTIKSNISRNIDNPSELFDVLLGDHWSNLHHRLFLDEEFDNEEIQLSSFFQNNFSGLKNQMEEIQKLLSVEQKKESEQEQEQLQVPVDDVILGLSQRLFENFFNQTMGNLHKNKYHKSFLQQATNYVKSSTFISSFKNFVQTTMNDEFLSESELIRPRLQRPDLTTQIISLINNMNNNEQYLTMVREEAEKRLIKENEEVEKQRKNFVAKFKEIEGYMNFMNPQNVSYTKDVSAYKFILNSLILKSLIEYYHDMVSELGSLKNEEDKLSPANLEIVKKRINQSKPEIFQKIRSNLISKSSKFNWRKELEIMIYKEHQPKTKEEKSINLKEDFNSFKLEFYDNIEALIKNGLCTSKLNELNQNQIVQLKMQRLYNEVEETLPNFLTERKSNLNGTFNYRNLRGDFMLKKIEYDSLSGINSRAFSKVFESFSEHASVVSLEDIETNKDKFVRAFRNFIIGNQNEKIDFYNSYSFNDFDTYIGNAKKHIVSEEEKKDLENYREQIKKYFNYYLYQSDNLNIDREEQFQKDLKDEDEVKEFTGEDIETHIQKKSEELANERMLLHKKYLTTVLKFDFNTSFDSN
jgi:hypothetical protein